MPDSLMNDSVMNKASLLPPNSTAMERAVEQVSARIDDVPVIISTLWDADTCPLHLLGWLAWALSVDVWQDDWDENIKRNVIRASMDVHRHKGTIGAVRRALNSLGIRIDISEWFEYDGAPHTFRLDAYADDIFAAGFTVNPKLLEMVTRVIDSIKPARSHLDRLRIGERFTSGQYIRTASRHKVRHEQNIDPMPFEQEPLTRIHIRQAIKHKFVHKYYHNIATTNIGAFA